MLPSPIKKTDDETLSTIFSIFEKYSSEKPDDDAAVPTRRREVSITVFPVFSAKLDNVLGDGLFNADDGFTDSSVSEKTGKTVIETSLLRVDTTASSSGFSEEYFSKMEKRVERVSSSVFLIGEGSVVVGLLEKEFLRNGEEGPEKGFVEILGGMSLKNEVGFDWKRGWKGFRLEKRVERASLVGTAAASSSGFYK
ncbi:hypothetical protein AAC387_Pa06g1483 [Persea americana]